MSHRPLRSPVIWENGNALLFEIWSVSDHPGVPALQALCSEVTDDAPGTLVVETTVTLTLIVTQVHLRILAKPGSAIPDVVWAAYCIQDLLSSLADRYTGDRYVRGESHRLALRLVYNNAQPERLDLGEGAMATPALVQNIADWVETTGDYYGKCPLEAADLQGAMVTDTVTNTEVSVIEKLAESVDNVVIYVPYRRVVAATLNAPERVEVDRRQFAVLSRDKIRAAQSDKEFYRHGCNRALDPHGFQGEGGVFAPQPSIVDHFRVYADLQKVGMEHNCLVPQDEVDDYISHGERRIFAAVPSFMDYVSLVSKNIYNNYGQVSVVSGLHCQDMQRRFAISNLVPCSSVMKIAGKTCQSSETVFRQDHPSEPDICPFPTKKNRYSGCCEVIKFLDNTELLVELLMYAFKHKSVSCPPKYTFLKEVSDWYHESRQGVDVGTNVMLYVFDASRNRWGSVKYLNRIDVSEVFSFLKPKLIRVSLRSRGDMRFARLLSRARESYDINNMHFLTVFSSRSDHCSMTDSDSCMYVQRIVTFIEAGRPKCALSFRQVECTSAAQIPVQDFRALARLLLDTENFVFNANFWLNDGVDENGQPLPDEISDPTNEILALGFKEVNSSEGHLQRTLALKHCTMQITWKQKKLSIEVSTTLKF